MRALAHVLASASLLFFCACGGGIAPSGNGNGDGSGTPSGTTGSSGGSGAPSSGGSTHSNPTMPTGGGEGESGATCTVGSYVFCRCADRSEGTKECLPDRSFGACACDDVPPPSTPCSYPMALNPPGCPATYSHVYQGQPCDTPNLQCSYPGQGDPQPNCASTALLACRVAPGGATFWTAAQ
jgi:hypothetical protein